MDTELILHETILHEDIETAFMSPLYCMLSYLTVFTIFVNCGAGDYFMFMLCAVITVLFIDTYRGAFLELLSELYY